MEMNNHLHDISVFLLNFHSTCHFAVKNNGMAKVYLGCFTI